MIYCAGMLWRYLYLRLWEIYICFYYWYYTPKGYSSRDVQAKHKIDQQTKNTSLKNRYNRNKIPKSLDVIIIGSGISSLTCAGYLSRVGKTVLVLEQHDVAGGCTHTFMDKGVEHETGIHYIGDIVEINEILDPICDKPIEWIEQTQWCSDDLEKREVFLNGVYDEFIIGDKHYAFRAGEKDFVDDLVKTFPDEKENISKYMKTIKDATSSSRWFYLIKVVRFIPLSLQRKIFSFLKYIDIHIRQRGYFYYASKTTLEIMQTITQNEALQALLCAQFGDVGPTPSKQPFIMHAAVVMHYLRGGYYPKGGSSVFAQRIIPTIERSGGAVLVGKKVKQILLNPDNEAYGVEMQNGDQIFAQTVVSGIGIRNTYHTLLANYKKTVPSCQQFDRLLSDCNGPSSTFVFLYLKLEGNVNDLGIRSSNIWIWPEQDYDHMFEEYMKHPLLNPMPMFIASAASKDSTWQERISSDYCSMIILTMANYDWFSPWSAEKLQHRGEDYENLKKAFATRMLQEGLYIAYPQLRDKIVSYSVATPLSCEYYLNSFQGECYGLQCWPKRFTDYPELRPKTDIKNLYLTGQDICSLGFFSAMISGFLTAHSILGYGTLLDLLTDRNLIRDLKNVQKKNSEN